MVRPARDFKGETTNDSICVFVVLKQAWPTGLRVLAKGETITQDVSTRKNPAILKQLKNHPEQRSEKPQFLY